MSSEFLEFFEACRDAMLIVTPSGQIIQANAPAEALFGFEGDELAGQSARRLFPGQPPGRRGARRRGRGPRRPAPAPPPRRAPRPARGALRRGRPPAPLVSSFPRP